MVRLLPLRYGRVIAAPVLLTLLRILQVIAVGGEWSGAMTVTIEHAPAAKRGRYGALPQIGSPVGTLLSSGAFALVAFGRIAERFGSAKVTVLGGVLSAVFAYPVFWLVDTKQPALVIVGITVGIALLSIPYAVNGPLLSELFETRVRYSGVALASNLSGAISGFVPLIATGLLAASGKQSWSVALLLVVIALLTALGGYFGGRLRLPDMGPSPDSSGR